MPKNAVEKSSKLGKGGTPPPKPSHNGGRPKGSKNMTTLYADALRIAGSAFEGNMLTEFAQEWAARARKPGTPEFRQLSTIIFREDIFERIDAMANRAMRENLDFLHYRIYRMQFDRQVNLLKDSAKTIVALCGRRAGKTQGFSQILADGLVEGEPVLYIGLTTTKAKVQVWGLVREIIKELGLKVSRESVQELRIEIENGGVCQLGGNANIAEQEKYRGDKWKRVIVDECQSQRNLKGLIEDVLEPTLVDLDGVIYFGGTGPRVRGTTWERLITGEFRPNMSVHHWTLMDNPFIPDYQSALARIREDKGLSEDDLLYKREYLGELAYDDDALVLRLSDKNFYDMQELIDWVKKQPVTDVRITAGMDYGKTANDALIFLVYSTRLPERWVVNEYKDNHNDLTMLLEQIRTRMHNVEDLPALRQTTDKSYYIYADTNEPHMTAEFYTRYNLPVVDAIKQGRDMAIDILQTEVRTGNLKIPAGGVLADECLHTVFARDDDDNLTREIDEIYHPDAIFALIYALRPVWLQERRGE